MSKLKIHTDEKTGEPIRKTISDASKLMEGSYITIKAEDNEKIQEEIR